MMRGMITDVTFLYLILFSFGTVSEMLFHQTIGKLICGLKVVSTTSDKISFKQALIRNFTKPIDYPFMIGIIYYFKSKENIRFGDKLAKTNVVNKK
jgi:uncharacterized RDD family membrane protein YckC